MWPALRNVEASCARRLRREALHLLLGKRSPACNEICRSPSGGRERGPAIRLSFNSNDGRVNLCYMFGMAKDEDTVETALVALSSVAITSQDSFNSHLVTIMADSGALGHHFDDDIIRDLTHRLQDYVHLATPRKIITTGGAMLDGTAAGVLKDLVADDYGNQILLRVDIVVVPGIGRSLLSVMTVTKTDIMTIFDYENPRLKGIDITVPLKIENGDRYLFVLDLSADGCGAKELEMSAIANAQVWHH